MDAGSDWSVSGSGNVSGSGSISGSGSGSGPGSIDVSPKKSTSHLEQCWKIAKRSQKKKPKRFISILGRFA
eukprot:TRINITY_DN1130_c0_g1_i1.p2 TRINITY_DN1130_c0_g1~~TRINITY_DN1130_c0_g1_i1.p2  ORF type:complete len:71 (+),score=10.13 TRINITY_DN1130_c0_g1_i1:111-323(+)